MKEHWIFEDIDWSLFDPSKVSPELVQIMKAAGVVEHNSVDYGTYLSNVFPDDPEFLNDIKQWAEEELKHGKTLAAWVKLADPGYDFDKCFNDYVQRIPIPVDATESIRGSRTSELLARCMVEVGTSSFYSAIRDGSDEPLLRQICGKIAADEFRHYKFFYTYMKRYQAIEKMNLLQRLRVALGRVLESNSDELASAYYTANEIKTPYNRKLYTNLYGRLVYKHYKPVHIQRGMTMFCKAVGISANGWLHALLLFISNRVVAAKAAG